MMSIIPHSLVTSRSPHSSLLSHPPQCAELKIIVLWALRARLIIEPQQLSSHTLTKQHWSEQSHRSLNAHCSTISMKCDRKKIILNLSLAPPQSTYIHIILSFYLFPSSHTHCERSSRLGGQKGPISDTKRECDRQLISRLTNCRSARALYNGAGAPRTPEGPRHCCALHIEV